MTGCIRKDIVRVRTSSEREIRDGIVNMWSTLDGEVGRNRSLVGKELRERELYESTIWSYNTHIIKQATHSFLQLLIE